MSSGMQIETLMTVLFMIVLYYLTSPGVFFTLPDNSPTHDPMWTRLTHGTIFSVIFIMISPYLLPLFKKYVY